MKILKTHDFVSERIKIKPVTNDEWNKTKEAIRIMTKTVVKPGQDLCDGDVVLVGYMYRSSTNEVRYDDWELGIYNAQTNDVEYVDSYKSWSELKDTFSYDKHGLMYVHYVLKIWRPINDSWIRYPEDLGNIRDMDMNKNYIVVYENTDLIKKFNI